MTWWLALVALTVSSPVLAGGIAAYVDEMLGL